VVVGFVFSYIYNTFHLFFVAIKEKRG